MKTRRPLLGFIAILFAVALSGCVSARYKAAPKDTLPATVLNLTAAQPPIEAVVHSVIVYRGPGSWKRDAYWDEYVVSIVNHGAELLVVESASLTDFRGDATTPGGDPWLLEKQSRSRREELNRAAKAVLVQLGSGYMMVGVSMSAAWIGGGIGGAAVGVAGFAIFPAYVVGAVVRNINSRHDIEAEFARRRLVLPAIVTPGGRGQGSLFFRIAPGPQRLVLRYRIGNEPGDLAVDLVPLAGLHLQPESATPASPPTVSPQP
jgi:hypothetical protein